MKNQLFALLALLIGVVHCLAARPEAFEIGLNRTNDLPKGKEADGIIGDFVLRNDKVVALISGNLPLRRANMSTFYGPDGITPGCLYDLALLGTDNDQITIFSPAEQRGAVSFVRIVDDGSNGAAVAETVVTAPSNNGIYKRHEYRLEQGAQGVLITTTLRNESSESRTIPISDRWTSFARTGTFREAHWADAVDPADRAGYAYIPAEVERTTAKGNSAILDAGQEIVLRRFLAVGRSPAEAVGATLMTKGDSLGQVEGRLLGSDGKAVTKANVLIRSGNQSVSAYPDDEGKFSIGLPAGTYQAEIADMGRAMVKRDITVEAGGSARLDVELGPLSEVAFKITDEAGEDIPCKAQFIGMDGTATPNLGPANRAHGCRDQYHSETGSFRTALPPGKYRMVVTRGIEYSHIAREIEVKEGQAVSFEGKLKRLVDTTGWVSADYHNHSTPSGDNTTGTDDRIINLAAEHVEFAPTTEHNRHYDWRPHIEKLGLIRHLNTVSGIELTGSGPHLNSFPFHPHPHRQDNGAPVWNPDPRITALFLRNHQGVNPDRWIQINHPDLVENFIDRNKDGIADSGYVGLGQLIDGLEVQNFSDSQILSPHPVRIQGTNVVKNREFIWLQLLNRGHRLVGMAVCDAHSVHGNGVGGWRMYMPSKSDLPAEIDWRENSRHAKAGRSILTTGPFLRVQTAEGHGPGSDVRASGGVTLQVQVQCTDWIDIDRVQILVNGRQKPELNFTRAKNPQMFKDGVVKFAHDVYVPLQEDAHVIVVAMGENFTLKTGYGTSSQASMRPCAFNNPIFVDVDGGGFKGNGDMLGYAAEKAYSLEEARAMLGEK